MTQSVADAPTRGPGRTWRRLALGGLVGVAVSVLAVVTWWPRPRVQTPQIPQTAPSGALDLPEGGLMTETSDVFGWAIDQGAPDGTGVDRVQLYLDGAPLADAHYGAARADIAAAFGAQFGAAGWSATLDPRGLAIGPHTLEAQAHSTVSDASTAYTRTIRVEQPSSPQGALDVPTEGAAIHGLVEVRGWALDELAAGGIGIDRIALYLDGQYVAEAEAGRSRPEIGTAYGDRFGSSGWVASLDVSGVPPGPHTLEVRAHSAATGRETTYAHAIVVAP